MNIISPKRSDLFKQSMSAKYQTTPFLEFDEKERAYKLRIDEGIHVLKNECPGKKRKL